MQVVYFATRAAAVLALLCAQVYLFLTQGIVPGIPTLLAHQTGLQILVMLVAPAGTRMIAAGLAAWLSVALGIIIAVGWMTVVVPLFMLVGAVLNGEPGMLLSFLGLTAYLAVPAAIIFAGYTMDEALEDF